MYTMPAPKAVVNTAATSKTITRELNPLAGWLRLERTKIITNTPIKPNQARVAIPCSKAEIFMVPPKNLLDYNHPMHIGTGQLTQMYLDGSAGLDCPPNMIPAPG